MEYYTDLGMHTKATEFTLDGSIERSTEPFERYDEMLSSFAQMVHGEKANPWDYDYELTLYRCIMKACGR